MRRRQALPSQAADGHQASLVYSSAADLVLPSWPLAAQPFRTRLYFDITKHV